MFLKWTLGQELSLHIAGEKGSLSVTAMLTVLQENVYQKIQSFLLILLARPMSLDILRSKFFVVLVVHTKNSSLEDVL